MDKKQAEAFASLLRRKDLTIDERRALHETLHAAANGVAKLDLAAFSRHGPPASKIRLCLDFGTAMSKAWATGKGAIETLPLLIGKAAGADGLTVPSSIYIDDSGRIYLGHEAELQHRAEAHLGRPRFDNLKRMLSEAEVGTRLDALPLRAGIDPTKSGLTGGDLLILYFSWLIDLSEVALDVAIKATKGGIAIGKSDVRGVARRFAIPCFESTDGKQGQGRSKWARDVMTDALLRAQVLADTLHGKWNQLRTEPLKAVMKEVYNLDVRQLGHLMIKDSAIREPIAAGASRFDAALGARIEPVKVPIRQYLLVVDAGAGTTDFALFQAITPIGETNPRYALLRKSVRMSRIAGNEIDAILRPHILKACGVDPTKLSADDLAYATMDLESQIRDVKRNLFDKKSMPVTLRPNFSGLVNLQSLLSDPKMRSDGSELIKIRHDILANVFSQDQLDVLRTSGGSVEIFVLLTGGSGALPIVKALAAGQVDVGGCSFRFILVDKLPGWIDRLPRESAQQLADVYPQCAVAIGGSVPELPREIDDLELPVTPPQSGQRVLPRNQITGV
jgi:hypothetical protein